MSYKKLFTDTIVYGLSSIVGRALNFLLVPFYTGILSTEDFGIMSVIFSITAFLNEIFRRGMETTYFRYASDGEEKDTFNHVQSGIIISTFLLGFILILTTNSLASYLNYSKHTTIFYYAIALIVIDTLSAIPFNRLRHNGQAKKFASLKLINIGLNIGLNLFFFLILRNSTLPYSTLHPVSYIFIAYVVANSITFVCLYKEWLLYKFKFDKTRQIEYAKYASPLLVAGVFFIANEMIDRIMLVKLLPQNFYYGFSTDEAIGIYSACYKITIFIALANQAFKYASEPLFFKKTKEKDGKPFFAISLQLLVVFGSFSVISLSFFKEFIAHYIIRNEELQEGLFVVPVLLLANLFLLMYSTQSIWYKVGNNKTHFSLIISAVGVSLTFLINYFGIPLYGYLASAYATLVCYGTMSILSFILGHKHYPIPYKWFSLGFYIILTTALITLNEIITFHLSLKIILLTLFIIISVFLERKTIKQIE